MVNISKAVYSLGIKFGTEVHPDGTYQQAKSRFLKSLVLFFHKASY